MGDRTFHTNDGTRLFERTRRDGDLPPARRPDDLRLGCRGRGLAPRAVRGSAPALARGGELALLHGGVATAEIPRGTRARLTADPQGPHARAVSAGDCAAAGAYGATTTCEVVVDVARAVTVTCECEPGYPCAR
jgi:hypothetical protein